MGRTPTIFWRELRSYLYSPLAYVLAGLYLALINLLVISATAGLSGPHDPMMVLGWLVWLNSFFMVLIAPLVTMRLLSEEKATGSMEVLVTDPVSDWDIVLGKYLAGFFCLFSITVPLIVYVIIYWICGSSQNPPLPVQWPLLGNFLIALVGLLALYAAIGIFTSSLFSSQLVSALIAFVILFVIGPLGHVIPQFFSESPRLYEFAEAISIPKRMETLVSGQLDTRPLVLMISTTVLFLYLTVRVVESRKWR